MIEIMTPTAPSICPTALIISQFIVVNLAGTQQSQIPNVQHRASNSAITPDRIGAVGIVVAQKGAVVINSGANHSIDSGMPMKTKNTVAVVTETANPSINNAAKGASRRKFLGQVGAALTGGVLLGKVPLASAQSEVSGAADVIRPPNRVVDPRVTKSFTIRVGTATREALIPVPPHTTNGDEDRYPDKSGTYSKSILQDGIGLVNLNAYQTFKTALNSGRNADFENIIIGGTRALTNPQGGLAFPFEGSDALQFGKAPSPA